MSFLIALSNNQIINLDEILVNTHGCMDESDIVCIQPSLQQKHHHFSTLDSILKEKLHSSNNGPVIEI